MSFTSDWTEPRGKKVFVIQLTSEKDAVIILIWSTWQCLNSLFFTFNLRSSPNFYIRHTLEYFWCQIMIIMYFFNKVMPFLFECTYKIVPIIRRNHFTYLELTSKCSLAVVINNESYPIDEVSRIPQSDAIWSFYFSIIICI